MKKLLFSALALGLFAVPAAQAGVIIPNLYANEYCSLMDAGSDQEGAIKAAVRAALIDGEPTVVMITGEPMDADVVRAWQVASVRCPQHF